jgi:adenylate cyclase
MSTEIARPIGPLGKLLSRLDLPLLGPHMPARLPDRVARAIQEQDARSEVLICWVQFAAVLFFAVVYFLSPRAYFAKTAFEPVPLMLAVYAVFIVIRYRLASTGKLADDLLRLSVVADVALLMLTIWSFHIQYQQPATLYLKAPTLLYVFVIIALRALRFDPRWVILAGISSAVGWLMLLIYALRHQEMESTITHSFVEYATSLKLLVGAEVDKIVSILAFTAVLALALERARRLLVRQVIEQASTAELSRFFAPDIAERIIQSDEKIELGKGIERQAAVMFLDLRGFTTFSSTLAPDDLVGMVISYQSCVVPIIRKHGGSVITYLGDGIMITFGATKPSTTFSADCLRATEELLVALPAWTAARKAQGLPASGAGIGVASGPVTYGAIGTEGRLEYAVIGDPVSRSAKLQSQTKAQRSPALATSVIWDEAIAQGYVPACKHDVRVCDLPGISEPVGIVAMGS